jgi:hypothetical protein
MTSREVNSEMLALDRKRNSDAFSTRLKADERLASHIDRCLRHERPTFWHAYLNCIVRLALQSQLGRVLGV